MSDKKHDNSSNIKQSGFLKVVTDPEAGMCFACIICRGKIPFRWPIHVPICRNCLDTLKDIVDGHKKNWRAAK